MRSRVKYVGCLVLSVVMVLTGLETEGFALKKKAKQEVTVEIDGKPIEFPDAKPLIDENNRVQVPIRFVTEAMKAEVVWSPEWRRAMKEYDVEIVIGGVKVVIITIGKRVYHVKWLINGQWIDKLKAMDTAALIKQNRAYVPIRFIAENMGAKVEWDNANRKVIIQSNQGIKEDPDHVVEVPKDSKLYFEDVKRVKEVRGIRLDDPLKSVTYGGWTITGIKIEDNMKNPIIQSISGDNGIEYYDIASDKSLSPYSFFANIYYVDPEHEVILTNENLEKSKQRLRSILLQKIDVDTVNKIMSYFKNITIDTPATQLSSRIGNVILTAKDGTRIQVLDEWGSMLVGVLFPGKQPSFKG